MLNTQILDMNNYVATNVELKPVTENDAEFLYELLKERTEKNIPAEIYAEQKQGPCLPCITCWLYQCRKINDT